MFHCDLVFEKSIFISVWRSSADRPTLSRGSSGGFVHAASRWIVLSLFPILCIVPAITQEPSAPKDRLYSMALVAGATEMQKKTGYIDDSYLGGIRTDYVAPKQIFVRRSASGSVRPRNKKARWCVPNTVKHPSGYFVSQVRTSAVDKNRIVGQKVLIRIRVFAA